MENRLKNKLDTLPKSPGIYQFLNEAGDILYVGKAKCLKNRVKSYFLKELNRGPAIDIMVSEAFDLKFIETESEIEAVILEANLIKQLKPKYNVRLRDDKSFLVIKITKKVKSQKIKDKSIGSHSVAGLEFPCVELVRYKNVDFSDKTAEYFGPYPSGLLLKKSINILRKIFPFRDCSKTKYHTACRKNRPCIYGDIRVCTAPCAQWVHEAQYVKNIKLFKAFLRGEKQKIIYELKKEMEDLSRQKRFEEAALVRDKLNALDHLKEVALGLRDDVFNGSGSIFKRIECYDISNLPTGRQALGEEYAVGSMVVFSNGKKDTDEYRKFKIKNKQSNIKNDLERMRQVLRRRFRNDWPKPDLIVIDGGQTHLNIAKEVLKNLKLSIPTMSIAKGRERKKNDFYFGDSSLGKYFKNNKELQNCVISIRDESHRFAIAYYRTLHKKDIFR